MRMSKIASLGLVLALALTGCTKEEGTGGGQPSSTITGVKVSPFQATVKPGESVKLLATVSGTGTFSGEVDWTVDAGGGSVEPLPANPQEPVGPTALFTAAEVSRLTTLKVRATSKANPAVFGEALLYVPSRVPPDLLITEIGATYYRNQPAWVEVFNGTSRAIDLGGYALRANAIDSADGTDKGVLSFPLPSVLVPPGGYVVVAGRTFQDGTQLDSKELVYVSRDAATVPWWFQDGFVELVQTAANQTVDFVRFGANKTAPVTLGAWRGSGLPGLPIERASSLSLVRAPGASDVDDVTGWSQSPFATPGGPNDVPASATDGDGDGIPDSAEVEGGTFAGMDLYAMGARVQQKDVFIEVDHMDSTDPGLSPLKEALDKVVAVFAARSIHVHFDAGTRFSAAFNPALYNLGQGSPVVPYAKSIYMGTKEGIASNLYAYKAASMRLARHPLFHYCLFASSLAPDGSYSNTGLGELGGNDFMVLLGGYGYTTSTATARTLLTNVQAATVMHEFGHNLGLDHGGDVATNYKPNYMSVMNYLYTINGLGRLNGSTAGDRYYYQWSMNGYTSLSQLADAPTTTAFVMDFSDGSGAPIDENSVNEVLGVARPEATFIDYDGNKAQGVIAIDLNRDGKKEVLRDFNDWANIRLPFQALQYSVGGVGPRTWEPTRPSFVDDVQPVADETPPPPAFLDAIRAAAGMP